MHYIPEQPEHEHVRGDVRGWRPEVRIVAAVAMVLAISALPADVSRQFAGLPAGAYLAAAAMVLSLAIIVAGISWQYLAMRWTLFLPWIAVFAAVIPVTQGATGWPIFAGIVLKAWLAFTTLLVVVRSTPIDELLRGLVRLRVPRLLVATIATMDRYTFLFLDEFRRLRRAQAARTFRRNRLQQVRTTAGMMGLVLSRSYDRANRVHAAMLARGYRGTMPTLNRE